MKIRAIASALVLLAAAGAARSAESGYCEIKITGDRTLSLRESALIVPDSASYKDKERAGRVSAAADYWMTEAQIRSTLSVMSSVTGKSVEEGMRADPRMTALTLNCGNEAVSLSIGPSASSKYANVPFAPKQYVLVDSKVFSGAQGFGDQGRPGEFVVMAFTVKTGSERSTYATTAPGTLVITQFDGKGVKGSFSFKARQRYVKPGESVSVSGTFSLPCVGSNCK